MIPDFTKSKIKNKLRLFPDYSCFSLLTFFRSGKNQVTNPNNGINAQTLYTASIPNLSAILPRTADAMPATPNAKPKKSPEISPNLLGSSSCAYNRIAGKADESIKPTQKLRIIVHTSPACGINKLKGAVPRIDPKKTY